MIAFFVRCLRKIASLGRVPFLYTPCVREIDRRIPFGSHHSYTQMPIEEGVHLIKKMLLSQQPCMIARFGRTEINSLARIHFMLENKPKYQKILDFLCWKNNGFSIETHYLMKNMKTLSGFFPLTRQAFIDYYTLCLQDMPECDLLASWTAEERIFHPFLKETTFIPFCLGSFLWMQKNPWTAVLEGKKVLVIHPFAQSIQRQYSNKREQIFPGTNVLPKFDLQVIQAVQSIGDEDSDFTDWFAALDWMKDQINEKDFDIALIGCGAYGFNLAAHVKRMGKKAVHIGGDLQYLFGIVGHFLEKNPLWASLQNDAWTHALDEERPKGFEKIENSCYW